MRGLDPDTYAAEHPHFLGTALPPLLEQLARRERHDVILDLGAGDGGFLWALRDAGALGSRTIAVDHSATRIETLTRAMPEVEGIVADGAAVTAVPDASIDLVICSQVIEHVPDDAALTAEIARMLRPGGRWYVSSVLRGRHAWWRYRRDGEWWLDPTHEREYPTVEAYETALAHENLQLDAVAVSRFRFPLADGAMRLALSAGVVDRDRLVRAYSGDGRAVRAVRRLALSPPGYRLVEAVGRRV